MSFRPPIGDASTIKKGIVQLAGDLGGTAAAPTVPGLSTKLNSSQVGVADGVASLDANGKVPSTQLELTFPVTTVAGRSGDVTLTKTDVGLSSVDNTSDADKPVSSATQTALNAKAGLSHAHAIADVTSLQLALDDKANQSTTYTKAEVDTALGGKAATSHNHTTASITDFIEDTQDIIGSSLTAGSNVTINYDDPSGITTISATPGAGVTDLSTTTTASDVTVVSSTGDDAVLPAATTGAAGVLTAGDKTKLDGVATGATANSADATLLDRANHTGTQAISTVTALQTALDDKATTAALTSGLAGKADVSHAHVIADTTGLQTALDGKQAAGSYATAVHTHAATEVTDFTEAAQDIIGTSLVAGANVTLTYDDTEGTTTVAATQGVGVTDLSVTTTGTDVTVVSSTGNDAVIAIATVTDAGVMAAADKTKLDGVATGATANSADATLLDRANHTGTQAISTVTALQTALDGKQAAGSYAAATHSHTASEVSDSTVTGRSVLTATDAAAARTAIGAGTSNLALGATGSTAKAGDYVPTWTEVTGKPSTFTPSAHAHAISDVTDLQTTLDGKAAVSHAHTASEVSDSTVTGRAVMTATDAAAARVALGVTNTVEVVDDFADVTTPVYGTLYVMRA